MRTLTWLCSALVLAATMTACQLTGPAAAAYQGVHERADCKRIRGWAWDSARPNTPVEVAIHDGQTLLATLTADQFRQDLLDAGKGNGAHSFVYDLPAQLKDGQPHQIRVTIMGTDFALERTPQTLNCTDTTPVYRGSLDAADCKRIKGWAWDSTRPDTPVEVAIYDDQTLVANVTADRLRQDLRDSGKGNGMHGFNYETPAQLKDGQAHEIRVTIAGTDVALENTPQTLTCNETTAAYRGSLDEASCDRIKGWAWDSARPNTSLEVAIYDGQTLVANVTADQLRQDLRDSGKGNGLHGFSYATPAQLKDGQPHEIRVTIIGTDVALEDTPKEITCQA